LGALPGFTAGGAGTWVVPVIDVELRYDLSRHWSVTAKGGMGGFGAAVGHHCLHEEYFAGGGAAWNDFGRFHNKLAVLAGGTGFRYELARKYGLHMGVDVAFSEDDPAIYVQFGSAWMRP
jgi:hypothetical protein